MIPRKLDAFLLLLFVGVTAALSGRPTSWRTYNADQYALFHRSLRERFGDRSAHRLIPLSHDILRPRPENHDEKKNAPRESPDTVMIEVCNQDDDGLPCSCSSDEGFLIDCKNEKLKTAYIKPKFDSDDGSKKVKVERVNLEGNTITELYKGHIVPGHEDTLKELNLENNRIDYIEDGAFSGMNELVTLDLTGNRLSIITRKLFSGGEGLEWKLKNLYLDDNELTTIEDYAFKDLSMIEKIVLDNNIGLNLTNNTF
uniref:Uncharacterized protein n=1 Tax=Plectus sambesii TaxID=2011161 RepID=A0A914X5G5_9BILA